MRLLQLSAGKGNKSAKELLTKIGSQRAVAAARARSIEAYESTIVERTADGNIVLKNGVVVSLRLGGLVNAFGRPDAVLYKRGFYWGIWVEGWGEYQCDILSVPKNLPRATAAEFVYISEVMNDGSVVKLLDGRILEVIIGQVCASIWIGSSDGILLDGSRLLNISQGDMIQVSILR